MEATTRAPDIAGLKLFDSCVTLGRVVRAGTPLSLTPDNILEVMDKHDIAEALVHHNEARLMRPRRRGNRRLLKEIEGIPRLHPVWALEPPSSRDPQAALDMVEEMRAADVKVARLMMGEAPPLHWLWEDLCEVLEAHHVPCLLDFAPGGYGGSGSTQGVPDAWAVNGLREICLAHPELPMILSHVSGGLGVSYPTLPLMRRVPNLHVDVTSVVDYWRNAALELGPKRVLFATGMPFYDPATFVANIQYAHQFDQEAKRVMCGGNLRLLLEDVR